MDRGAPRTGVAGCRQLGKNKIFHQWQSFMYKPKRNPFDQNRIRGVISRGSMSGRATPLASTNETIETSN
jgi:hypothetical protein